MSHTAAPRSRLRWVVLAAVLALAGAWILWGPAEIDDRRVAESTVEQEASAAHSALEVPPPPPDDRRESAAVDETAELRFRHAGTLEPLPLDTLYWAPPGHPIVATAVGPNGRWHPISPGETFFLLGGSWGDQWFTFVELEASWEALVAEPSVDLWDGRPSPVRVWLDTREVQDDVLLTGPRDHGVRLGGLPYTDLEARGRSPLALPYRQPGAAMDLGSTHGRQRALVPLSFWQVGGYITFADIVLTPVHALSVELRSAAPIVGASFTLMRRLEQSDDLAVQRSHSVRLEAGQWEPEGAYFVARWDAGLVAPGSYAAGFVGHGSGLDVLFEPSIITVDGDTEASIWIQTAAPAVPTECIVRVRFAQPLHSIVEQHGRSLLLTAVARTSGQWLGSGPVGAFHLDASTAVQEDGYAVHIERPGGFAEGLYDVQIEPIGFTSTLEVVAGAAQATIEVPPIAAVQLRELGHEMTAKADVRIRPVGYVPRVGVNAAAVRPLAADGSGRHFALAHGDYEFVPDTRGFIDPAAFTISGPTHVIEYSRRPRNQRRVTFTMGGQEAKLPLSALASAKLVRDGNPVADAVVSAAGYQGAFGTLSGLDLTFPEPGTYDLHWRLELPGVGSREGVIEALEASPSALPPILVALDA